MGKRSATYSRREFFETFGKSAGAVAYLSLAAKLGLPIIGAGVSQSCKNGSPAEPEEPKESLYYRDLRVTYSRNPDKITNPGANWVFIVYRMYDPKGEHIDYDKEEYGGGYRIDEQQSMTWIDENKYEFGLKNVLVQTETYSEKHFLYVWDGKLSDGKTRRSMYTSESLDFSPSVIDIELESDGYTTSFRMPYSSNLRGHF